MIGPVDREALATMPFWVEHRDLNAFLNGLRKAELSGDQRFKWAEIYYKHWWMILTPEDFKAEMGSDSPGEAIKDFMSGNVDADPVVESVMDWKEIEMIAKRDEMIFSSSLQVGSTLHYAVWKLAIREWVSDYPHLAAPSVEAGILDFEDWARCDPKAFSDWLAGRKVKELFEDDGSETDELSVGFGLMDERMRAAAYQEWSKRRGLEGYDFDLADYWLEQNPEAALEYIIKLDNDYELGEALRGLIEDCETPRHVAAARKLILEFGDQSEVYSEGMLMVMDYYGDIDCGEAARFGVDWLLAHREEFRSKEQLIEVWTGLADPRQESMDGRTFGCLRKWAATEPKKMESWARTLEDSEVSAALMWMARHPNGRFDYCKMAGTRLKLEAEWIATLPESLVKEKLWVDWFLSEPERDERRRKFYKMLELVDVRHIRPLLEYYAEHCDLQTVDIWQNFMQLWADRDLFAALEFAYAEAPYSVDSIYINGWHEEPLQTPLVSDDESRKFFWSAYLFTSWTFRERGDDPSVPVEFRSLGEAFAVWSYNLWWNFQIDPYREYNEPKKPEMPKYSFWPRRVEASIGGSIQIDGIWKTKNPELLEEDAKLFELSAENLLDRLAEYLEKNQQLSPDLVEVLLGRYPEEAGSVEFILARYGDDQEDLDWHFGEALAFSISGYGTKENAVKLGKYVLKRGRVKAFYRDHLSDFLEELESFDVGLAARIGAEALLREHGDDSSEVLKGWAGGESDTNSDDSLGDRTFGCLRKWAVVDPDAMKDWINTLEDKKTRNALFWLADHPSYWTAEKL